jgi:hypothetical protein
MLGTEGLEPTRESQNTQSLELRFRALLGEEPKVELALVQWLRARVWLARMEAGRILRVHSRRRAEDPRSANARGICVSRRTRQGKIAIMRQKVERG